jgi:exopolysaccharide production protein ExoZ
MPNSTNSDGRLNSLQALRGIAALLVAASHLYGVDQRYFGGPVLPPIIQFGFAGVDLFFVLSGFVMVLLTQFGAGHRLIVPAFLFSRVTRVYPLWWLVLGVVSVVWLVRPALFVSTPNLQADFFLLPHEGLPFLAVGWTLIHEIYFYIAFGFLLLLPNRHFALGLLGWMLLIVVSNAFSDAFNTSPPPILKLVIHPLTLEFGFGVAVGLLATKGYRPKPFVLLLTGIIWLAIAGLFSLDQGTILFDRNWVRTLVFGPAWALVLWGIVALEADEGIVTPLYLVGLGNASYALYLVHVPIFGALSRMFSPSFGASPWDNVLAWLMLLLIAIFTAAIIHLYIERPILSILVKLRCKIMPQGSALIPSPPHKMSPKI